ncbi:hypothetical protein BZARG_485 [Bizionia argentinensis JUB59]|uniref:Lipoprotein n=1 Tax=Bizionia argentinensis JUB59 TaxID=1046627 RepID=G2EH98_9FLAO|nr:hypothetical protein [Bizionia argentinensis]EGV42299.2 hypothetical protein BZARG_485 [Bizionia argentinensis JUB59]
MKLFKILSIALVFSLSACATKHQVITESGEIYQVQGDKFFNQGKEVTSLISAEDKDGIITTLNKRLESEAEVAAQQKALQDAQDHSEELRKDAEKAQKEAIKAQKKAKKESEALQKRLKNEKKTRDNYVKSRNELKKAQSKYEKLHDKGKLTPKDEYKWAKKLNKLTKDFDKAEKKLNKI